jgi:DNA-binding MarR family transcriptional regulator
LTSETIAERRREDHALAATDPPDDAIDAAERLLALLHRLHCWAVASVQADGGGLDLSLRQVAVLFLIRDGAAFPSRIARKLRVTPAVVTGLLDRLEQRGHVRRTADPGDRRRQRLVLTPSGLEASRAVGRLLADDLADRLAALSGEELAAVARAVAALERVADDLELGAPAAGPTPVPAAGFGNRAEPDQRVRRTG